MKLITEAEMEAARSKKGGWTRETLAQWGVPWPPPKGWRKALLGRGRVRFAKPKKTAQPGEDVIQYDLRGKASPPSPIRPDETQHDLLRKVVVAVINNGHAADLYEFPDVLAYFGSRLPTEGMLAWEEGGVISASEMGDECVSTTAVVPSDR